VTDASARLVDHALGVEWGDLPSSAQQAARTFLHDTICVGVAGRSAANADLIWRAAKSWGGEGGACLILGRPGETTSAPYAAFANAFQIHAQEFDCVHEPAVAHPLATVLAALMAEAQRSGPYSGETFLAALVAGVDVVATLGVAVTTPLKFFRPATAGVFGSIAALARLRGLDRETAINAFGYGLAFASGTMQAHLEGKPTLAVQVANAARSAVEAIDLAAAGLEGPVGSIDGPFGYLPLFEDGFDLSVLDDLGVRQRIEELSWKPFPTGRAAHGAIVALRGMVRDGSVSASTLQTFVYRAPPLIARLIGRRPFAEMKPAYARLCFAYLGAVVLMRGEVGLDSFDAATLNDPAVLALAERIVVEADDNPDPAAFTPATAVATLTDGARVQIEVTRQFGSPGWPLSREEHFAKARACLDFGGLPESYDALAPIFDSFETVPNAAAALRPAFG
jgi:2-methylcitrate dehydratase PrpD